MNISAFQQALKEEGLDGWLFFDHHQRDLLAYRILGLPETMHATRRWYYLIPADGEPRKLVHRIESGNLDALPGAKHVYSSWDSQASGLARLLEGQKRVAMQYSPMCAIPYVSMVDAGTLELVRASGVEVTSSANLVQIFEARWTDAQFEMHMAAGKLVDEVRRNAFVQVAEAHRAGKRPTEYEIQQSIMSMFFSNGLVTDHPPIVGVNENAANPHYCPDASASREIAHGDVLLIDLWAKLDKPDAVFYDITWCGYCADAVPAAVERVFDVVKGARDAAVKRVRDAKAGGEALQGYQVDDACRGHIVAAGFGEYFVHRTGHSIGTNVHGNGANMDNLETHDIRTVMDGTCFSVEPGIYLPDFGIRSEVNVFVGRTEAVVTGEIQDKLVIVA